MGWPWTGYKILSDLVSLFSQFLFRSNSQDVPDTLLQFHIDHHSGWHSAPSSSLPSQPHCCTKLYSQYLPQFMADHLAISLGGHGDIPSFCSWGGLGRIFKYHHIYRALSFIWGATT
ncbi:hypothetical protein BKA83DRAFT_1680664 [Pisolithus microcarpus]|nr:hypothetical protein BKA83DRAFT_1680664 [Pisolithus microcarpus]